jgi:hypothetical protein
LSKRDPNWEEAKVKATKVIENTVPATPIIAPEIVDRTLLAESALSVMIKLKYFKEAISTERSMTISPEAKAIENKMMSTGINQKLPLNSFNKNLSFPIH